LEKKLVLSLGLSLSLNCKIVFLNNWCRVVLDVWMHWRLHWTL
jgi:hypothetical protein